jgi:anti-anti-sigma factor
VFREGNAVVMSVVGEIDIGCRDRLTETAVGLVAHHTTVIADLGEVTFLDSSGLGALVRARQEAIRLGHDFRIRSAVAMVAEVLEVTGLGPWLSGAVTAASGNGHASRRG